MVDMQLSFACFRPERESLGEAVVEFDGDELADAAVQQRAR